MTEHSKLPPSSAARRVACPGSRALEEKYKSPEMSPAAREGEAAHWVAALALADYNTHGNASRVAPNGEPITDEMREGAKLYVDTICNSAPGDKVFHIEERVDISIIHPDCFGTPDCWYINSSGLHIFDYKFGHGYVEVFQNWQLIEYAAGIVDYVYAMDWPENLSVTFHIIQPRSYHPLGNVRSWKTSFESLFPYFERLKQAEIEATQPVAMTAPSSECNYCVARHACPALRQSALTAADATYLNTPVELNSFQLGGELRYLMRAAELLDARIAGLSEQAISHIKRGDRVPYFALEEAPKRLKWGVPKEEVIKLGELLDIPLAKPVEPITPRQAIAAGIDEALVQVYCEWQRGALRLTAVDNDRSRKVFGNDS